MSSADWIATAEEYLQQGKHQQAATTCQTILQQQPNNATAYKLLGNIYQQQGDNTAAKQAYETAISLSPDFAEAYANLGNIYLQQKQWQAAIENYQTAIRLNPNLAGVYRNLAKLWQAKGDQNQATDCWQTAYELELDKLPAEGYFAVGNRYFQQQKLEVARECYQQAIQKRDNYTAAWQNLGEVYFWQQQWENAIECFEKVIRYHPNIAAAYRGLAKTYQKLNQPQKSSQAWFEALQLQPEWGEAEEYLTLGNNFIGYRDWEKAKQCYQQAIAMQPDYSQAYHNLAEIYRAQQQWQAAVDCYRHEIEINVSAAAASSYRKIVEALTNIEQWEEAIDFCQQGISHYPENWELYAQLGNIELQWQQWEEAREAYQQAIACQPSSENAWWLYSQLGYIYQQLDNLPAAVTAYQKAVQLQARGWPSSGMVKQLASEWQRQSHSTDSEVATIATIHHLPTSGGTVICKCLASQPHVVLLSELHPLRQTPNFNAFDPIPQFFNNYPEIADYSISSRQGVFLDRVDWIYQKAAKAGKQLILRDHVFTDFLPKYSPYKTSTLVNLLKQEYIVRPVVTLRNPIDAFLSSKMRGWHQGLTFDEYCDRVLSFINTYAGVPIFHYEDFTINPQSVIQQICAYLSLDYRSDFLENFHNIQLTGNSGRKSQEKSIVPQQTREFDSEFRQEVLHSPTYQKLCQRFGYESDPAKHAIKQSHIVAEFFGEKPATSDFLTWCQQVSQT